MLPGGNVDRWLAPPAGTKRKRAEPDYADNAFEKEKLENVPNEDAPPPKRKSTKTTAKVAPKKTGVDAKEGKKLFTETIKAIDKRTAELDKSVKTMSGNSRAITTASYASSVFKHVSAAHKLAAIDRILAFNLVLSMADASHTDLDATIKMCGTTDDRSKPVFKALDELLIPLIEQRSAPCTKATALSPVLARWTEQDAEVGIFKTGRPNKQQRNQMYRQKLEWEKERREARRERRVEEEDWVAVALSDLKEERHYLSQYGVRGYLPQSIAKLESIIAGRLL
ncbi:hypothetical protein LTR37_018677 [Vermiconidia calcicola]|uniref:Uncharacterized protein n=1 Tax=Vermiconidia calcicola TaxID=1690605 RepID=A0ACC3MG81_9PEZI|nr:hypothetical protein LTR37_018677 [Vermiconidia calcicola]